MFTIFLLIYKLEEKDNSLISKKQIIIRNESQVNI